jgi:hypothetical protein
VARHAFGQTFAYHALIRLAPIRASDENRLGFARPARLPRLCPGARLPLKAYAAFDRLTGPGQHWPSQTYRGVVNDIHGSPRGRGGMQSREAERLCHPTNRTAPLCSAAPGALHPSRCSEAGTPRANWSGARGRLFLLQPPSGATLGDFSVSVTTIHAGRMGVRTEGDKSRASGGWPSWRWQRKPRNAPATGGAGSATGDQGDRRRQDTSRRAGAGCAMRGRGGRAGIPCGARGH